MFTRYNTQKPVTGIQVNRRHSLSRGLVGCWLFNEGSGNKVSDLSGNGYRGTFVNDVSWKAGKFGSSLYFDGDADYVNCGGGDIGTGFSALSVSAWIKSDTAVGLNNTIVDRWRNPYIFQLYWSTNEDLVFRVANAAASASGITTGIDVFTDLKWHHVVGVYDGANVYAYVDMIVGNTVGNLTGTVRTGSSDLYIGSHGATGHWNGQIDNVLIFNRALTASEVALLYREPFCMFERDPIELWSATALAPPEGSAGIMTCNTGFWGPTF